MAEIITAKSAGFCPGVAAAVNTAMRLIDKNNGKERIYTLGKLIHNNRVVERLENLGVTAIEEADIDDVYLRARRGEPSVIIVRAHGVPKKVTEKLSEYALGCSDFRVIDRTCGYVKKIHDIVDRETSDNSTLLIIGDASHAEVLGIMSYAHADVLVASNLDELELCNLPTNGLVIVAQTTLNLSEWNKCNIFIKNHCTNVKKFDTICCITEQRQIEADELSKKVDLMYVIGSSHSSNAVKLFEIAKANQPATFMIEDRSGIDRELVKKVKSIGITAGASTPRDIIEEVQTTMNEEIKTSEENFEEMLESSLKTLNTGDVVTGVITSISSTEIHVDLSANVTGVLPIGEACIDASESIEDKYKVGDEITAFVVRVSDIEGVAGLSRKRIERITDWKTITDAKESGEVLEGRVTDVVKGGIMIQYKTVKLFVPASQTGVPKDGQMSELLGSNVKFQVIEVDNGRNRAVASIRSVLRKERKEAAAKIWDSLEVGQKFVGKVKSIVDYGIFVDIGGIDGMVHITELSWHRVKHPSELVSVGDPIEVYVKSFDPEKRKISLGCKTAETHPWTVFTSQYSEGDVVPVKIVNLTPFGAFAEIIPDIDGLIHISQIADRRIASPAEVLHVDDVVDAKITAIDNEKKKVSLSIRALLTPADEPEQDEADEESTEDQTAEDTPAADDEE